MTSLRTVMITLVLLLTYSGSVVASGGASRATTGGTAVPQQYNLCPDLAATETFRSNGLEFVHSLEFAEALAAVAGGNSRFSPPTVPEGWRTASSTWFLHVTAQNSEPPGNVAPQSRRERFSAIEEACDPQLLYKASLQYRVRAGNEKAGMVSPDHVSTAIREMEEVLGHLDTLYKEVAAKIVIAERMGASECSPSAVARAKEELAAAQRAATGNHYDPASAYRSFRVADQAADELIESRKFAKTKGLICYSQNNRAAGHLEN